MSDQSPKQLATASRRDYGKHVAIRSVAIVSPRPRHISLAMEDMGHAFQIDFTHDTKRITAIDAEWIRHPMTSCPGAARQVESMVGCELSSDLMSLKQFTNPRSHCTHMFDMMALAIVHAHQQRADCRYDVIIPDSKDLEVNATLRCNGRDVISLQLHAYDQILSPEPYAGRSIFKGFLKWAATELEDKQYEYCYLLQKAMFVARGQLGDNNANEGKHASLIGLREGTCFASQPSSYPDARVAPSQRLFSSESEAQVLRFFQPHSSEKLQ